MISNQLALTTYFPLITIFVSGVFALLVSITSNFLVGQNEKNKAYAARKKQRYEERENMYVSILDSLELVVKYRENLDPMDNKLTDRLQSLHSKVFLLEDSNVLNAFDATLSRLNDWQEAHYKANPKKEGNITLISSTDKYFAKDEQKAMDALKASIQTLVSVMKAKLDTFRREIQ